MAQRQGSEGELLSSMMQAFVPYTLQAVAAEAAPGAAAGLQAAGRAPKRRRPMPAQPATTKQRAPKPAKASRVQEGRPKLQHLIGVAQGVAKQVVRCFCSGSCAQVQVQARKSCSTHKATVKARRRAGGWARRRLLATVHREHVGLLIE